MQASRAIFSPLTLRKVRWRSSQENLNECFLLAAEQSEISVVEECITQGVDINCSDKNGYTALHFASDNEDLSLAYLLLSRKKLNIDSVTKFGRTPLLLACMAHNYKMVQLLLKNGADPNKPDFFNQTCLHYIALTRNVAVAQVMFKHGAEVNVIDSCGETPLSRALIRAHFFPMAKLFIKQGANPNLHFKNSLPLLLEKLQECFLIAVEQADLKEFRRCVSKGVNINWAEDDGFTALHIAAEHGSIHIIRELLSNKHIKIDLFTQCGVTPLILACRSNQHQIVQLLLKGGANPNFANRFCQTPLHYVVLTKNVALAQSLLKYGATVNPMDCFGTTPLSRVLLGSTFIPMAKLLFRFGVNPNLHLHNELPLLLECVLSCRSIDKIIPVIFLLKKGVDINTVDTIGKRNALHFVALTGFYPLAERLLEMGCDKDALDYMGRKPIDISILYENNDITDILMENNSFSEEDNEEVT